MKLVGTEALVTGANRGLGRSLVKALAKAGTPRIHVGARDRFQLPDFGPQTSMLPLELDITDTEPPRVYWKVFVQILSDFIKGVQVFIEGLLCFLWRDVSDGAVQAVRCCTSSPISGFPIRPGRRFSMGRES